MDKIFIKDLFLRCIIGINPEERTKKQDIIINVTLHADLASAGKSDDIEDTIDYKKMKMEISNSPIHRASQDNTRAIL